MEDIPRPGPDAARVVVVDGWRRLRSDPRVGVALLLLVAIAAGGSIAGADLSRLNLAALVADGERIAVPLVGQPPPAVDPSAVVGGTSSPSDGTDGSGSSTASTGVTVNINTATVAELDTLPGIGPATAAAIIRERDAHGPFRSVDDLERVKGIGPAKLEQLHDHVTV